MPRRRNDPREWEPVKLIDPVNGEREQGRLSRPWQCIMCNPATYPPEIFTQVAIQLIHHPERNSKNIRRADILFDTDDNPDLLNESAEKVDGMVCTRSIRRRLMPRNPNLDPELEQTCRLYAADGEQWPTLVTYHCHYNDAIGVPYYVPDVLGVAFELYEGNISLAYLPLPGKPCTDERLQRVAINLLRTIHRHCVGTEEGYEKRVHHDILVDKSAYQDLYIFLKNKYAKQLIRDWAESTDPLKHAFEDISLAAFLILLWKESHGNETKFVDIGCGNGVLVYLLVMEGYEGYGFDARRRKSWKIFPQHVQDRLYEKILIPSFLEDITDDAVHNGRFDDQTFLISNHADELTPYTPLVAAMTPGSGFLAIPCCEHDFSGVKAGGRVVKTTQITAENDSLGQGKYGMYCEWICEIARQIGWTVEREMLRIPSTRNVGIVGRQIAGKCNREQALEVIQKVGGQNGFDGFIERAKGLKDKVHRGH